MDYDSDEEVLDEGFGVMPVSDSEEEVLDEGFGVMPVSDNEVYGDSGDETLIDEAYGVMPVSDYQKGKDYDRNWYFNTNYDAKSSHITAHRTKNTRKITIRIKNIGAIGIFTHGIYKGHNLIPLPKNVVVNEYSVSSDGCSILGPTYNENDELCVDVTKKSVSDLGGCINEHYVKSINVKEPGIDPEISCNLYLKVKELKEKEYSVEPEPIKDKDGKVIDMDYSNIIFMIALNKRIDEQGNQLYKKVNLSLCSMDELKDFFKLNPDSLLNEANIEQFIIERDFYNEITTTQLVMLIQLANTYLNLGHLNILDTSCSPRPLAREGLRSYHGVRRLMHNTKYMDPNFVTSFGTKRKRNTSPNTPNPRTKTRKTRTKTRKSRTYKRI